MTRATTSRVRALLAGATPAAATAQTAAAGFLFLFLNLCTGVLTARVLGPQGRGELAAVTTWPQFMAFLLTLGLPTSILYNLKKHPDMERSLFWSLIGLALAMGLVASGIGVLFLPYWLTEYPGAVVAAAKWAMLLAPVYLLYNCLVWIVQAREEFALFNVARLAPPGFTLLFLGIAMAIGPVTSLGAAAATLLAVTPIFLFLLQRLCRAYPFTLERMPEAHRRMLSYGIRSYGVSVVGALGGQLDRALLVGMVSPEMLGTYVVAANASLAVAALPTALGTVLLPRASGRVPEQVIAMTGRAARASLIGSVPTAIFLMATGPFVIRLLYGEGFSAAVPVFRILLAEAVLRGLVTVLAQAFMALDRPGLATVVDATGLSVLLAALVLLVPPLGLAGAGAALVLSALARLGLMLGLLKGVMRVPLPRLLPGGEDLRLLRDRLLERPGP